MTDSFIYIFLNDLCRIKNFWYSFQEFSSVLVFIEIISITPQPRSLYQNWTRVVHCLIWLPLDLLTHRTTSWPVGAAWSLVLWRQAVSFSLLELGGDRSLTTWERRDGVTPVGPSAMAVLSCLGERGVRILQRSSLRGLAPGLALLSNIQAGKEECPGPQNENFHN